MAIQPFILEVALLQHGQRVSDVGGVLHGSIRGDHLSNPLPSVRTPPVLQCASMHTPRSAKRVFIKLVQVGRLGGQPYGHLSIRPRRGSCPSLGSPPPQSRSNRSVSAAACQTRAGWCLPPRLSVCTRSPWPWKRFPPALVMPQVYAARSRNWSKHGYQAFAVVGRNGGQAYAQAEDVVPGEVHAPPIWILARLAVVMQPHHLRIRQAASPRRER